jgi:hypothetical protein
MLLNYISDKFSTNIKLDKEIVANYVLFSAETIYLFGLNTAV